MAAITPGYDRIQYVQSFAADAGAAINEPYACVILGTGDNDVIQSSAAQQPGVGFIRMETGQTYAVAGSVAQVAIATRLEVWYLGIVWAVAAAAFAKGIRLGTAAGGQVVTASAASPYVAISLAAAAAQHEIVPVLICIGTSV